MTQNFFENSTLKKRPYPFYLSDISPLDFDLLGKRKGTLIAQEIPDEIGLLEIVSQIVDRISVEELQAVFRSWIECVQNIIDANGDYIS
jgi:hypothetical protein